jgi:hypothetical protein
MNKLYKVEDIVKTALIENPETREDDFLLIAEVYHRIDPLLVKYPFSQLMLSHKELKLPSFKSMTRCRRKLQNLYPNLKPSKKIQDARLEEQLVYREYAR